MKKKSLLILFIVCVVFCVLGLISLKKKSSQWNDNTQISGKVIEEFPLNDITKIILRNSEKSAKITKKDGIWCVSERNDYLADFEKIRTILKKFYELKITEKIVVGPSQYARLELLTPDKQHNTGTIAEFYKNGSAIPVASVLLGKEHKKKGGDTNPMFGGMGGGSWPDGRYLKVDEQILLVADPLREVVTDSSDWLNKDFVEIKKIKSVVVLHQKEEESWTLSRYDEKADWKLDNLSEKKKLKDSEAKTIGRAFSSASFNDVILDAKTVKTALNKPTKVTIETLDGFVYNIAIGNVDNKYYLTIDTALELPEKPKPDENAKEEDVKKDDKQWEEKIAALKEKLDKEKKFNQWTYEVSNWTVKPLIKKRSELLEDKVDKKKKEK
ncbi:MAG: DUF4340 domain-containing protein [Verrucomicrobiota bacterium]|nr:DUF4340 domain-containing protein [Verrucomicrobiota bacterium]